MPSEEGIILHPDDQRRRRVRAQVDLKLRIDWNVGAAVLGQVDLDSVIAGPVEQPVVDLESRIGRVPTAYGGRIMQCHRQVNASLMVAAAL
ncbi:MAG: hypothetical protein H7099_03840 [Gemmatimonadaceae bacterium]|nr:hypothetical protein [Gemmatimonadaceae bacterium]